MSWTFSKPGENSITVTAAGSADGVAFGSSGNATDGVDLTVADGRFLKVTVRFTQASSGEGLILFDLTLDAVQRPRDPKEGAIEILLEHVGEAQHFQNAVHFIEVSLDPRLRIDEERQAVRRPSAPPTAPWHRS